jgi:hypothetical protein
MRLHGVVEGRALRALQGPAGGAILLDLPRWRSLFVAALHGAATATPIVAPQRDQANATGSPAVTVLTHCGMQVSRCCVPTHRPDRAGRLERWLASTRTGS